MAKTRSCVDENEINGGSKREVGKGSYHTMSEAHDFGGGGGCLVVGSGFVFNFHVCGWNDHGAKCTGIFGRYMRYISRSNSRGINICIPRLRCLVEGGCTTDNAIKSNSSLNAVVGLATRWGGGVEDGREPTDGTRIGIWTTDTTALRCRDETVRLCMRLVCTVCARVR